MKKCIAVLLASLTSMLGSWGCATVTSDIARSEPSGTGTSAPARVDVAIFDRRSDLADGLPAPHPVASRLSRLVGKELVAVHESKESSWSLPELPPGKYLFAVTGWTDAAGQAHAKGTEEVFHVAPGERVVIKAVLEDRLRNSVVTAVAVGGTGVIVYLVYTALKSMFSWGSGGSTTLTLK